MECDDDIVILIVDDINMTLHTKVDNDIDTSLQTKVDNDNDTLLHTKEEPAGDDILYQNPGNLNSEIETSVKVEAVDEETITDQENFYVDNANDTVYLPEHEDHEKNEVQEEYEIQEKHEIHEEHEVQEEFEEHEVNCEKPVPKTKSRMLKPSERVSYVKCWKSTYPELKDDKELLLDCLVAVMNEIKPPPPPTDYYSLDGIMLKCIHCDHQSATIPKATRHYQETHGERYLHCLACGVNFRSKTTLYKHEKTCIAPDAVTVLKARARQLGDKARSRPFLCKPKKKTPKMFPCTDCPAIFKVRSGLTAHQRTHTGQRPYVCWQCLKAYTSNTALRRHEKLHTSQRFECAHCARIFRTRALITAHLDTHLPQKRFACAECSRRYAQRFALQLHVDRVHRGLPPPFACQLCPKRFARLSILKEHMQKAHGLDIVTRKV